MSDNTVEITENSNYSISIDTSLIQNENNIEIQLTSPINVDVINNTTVLVGDLPQGYPLDWTVGDLPISRVSGLDIVGSDYINVIDNSGTYTISATGLQPSGDYSVVGHHHMSSDIDDLIPTITGLVPVKSVSGKIGDVILTKNDIGLNNVDNTSDINKPISILTQDALNQKSNIGHSHIISDVSGLQNALDSKQPSGNYSVVGHNHTASDITDFSASVSGILPVKNISSGSGIQITNIDGDFNVAVTGQFGLTGEEVDNRVSNLLSGGDYININSYNISSSTNETINSIVISATGLQPSGDYSLIGHSHTISDVSNLQNELDAKQPSGNYSIVGHSHVSSDITDFNVAVSGLIPPSNFTSLTGISGVVVSNSGTNYFVGLIDPTIQLADITDLSNNSRNFLLTPSSNNLQSLVTDETGSGLLVFNTSPSFSGIPTVPTAPSGTNTTQIANTAFVRSEIANLIDSSPSTLDTLNELAAALNDDPNFATTVASGLANKAPLIHNHVVSDITDFNSGVSGLLPVTNILSGTNINVLQSGSVYTINVSGSLGLTTEEVDDRVGNLLVEGSYINLNYDDNNNILTISATGLQPSGNYSVVGHTHVVNDITDFNSSVSGLLPTISNSGNNRILTSTGSSVGINAENNLTFDGSILNVSGQIIVKNITLDDTGGEADFYISSNKANLDFAGYNAISFDDGSIYLNGFVSGVNSVFNSGNFINGLTVNNIPVSVSGHTHDYSEITNWASGIENEVSTLLVAGNYIDIDYDSVADTLTINATGLQPSGNYASATHSHGNISNSGTIGSLSGLLLITNSNGIITTTSGINSSYITNFNSSVSGLLPSISGSGYVASSFDNNSYTISVSGLQPSGNYANSVHTHSSSEITDFTSSVSGLLPVTNILGGSNITISQSGSIFTVAVTGSLGLTPEEVDDRVDNLLVGGSYINLAYDDDNNLLTISATGLQPSGNYSIVGHSHVISDISGLQTALDSKQPSGNYSLNGHTHLYSDILVSGNAGYISAIGNDASLFLYEIDDDGLNEAISELGGILSFNITDFNSAVSGLLPTIANSGDNRILTSTGSSVGVNAESNLTFDGSLLSVSGNLIADTGTFSIIQLDTENGPTTAQGQLAWNDTEGTVDIALTDTAIINIGEHEMYRVRNTTGNVLYKGQAVMASGVHSNGIITPSLYAANGSVREIRFMGLVYENVNDNNNGYVIHFGHIYNIDTRGSVASNIAVGDETWNDGDVLYVHPTVAGKLTNVEPKHSIAAAIVLDAANNGKIFVRPTSYGHLNDNHDVSTSGASNGQFLQYDAVTDYWVPSSSGNFSTLLVNGTGVSLVGHTHSSTDITDFNTAVSGLLTVTDLVAGSGIVITPSGSAFTINSTGGGGSVNDIIAGSGITVSSSGGDFTINTIENIINSSNLYLWANFR